MPSRTRSIRRSLIGLCVSGSLLSAVVGAAAAATPGVPIGLSEAERASALASMSREERALRRTEFASSRYVVVSYARTAQGFDRAGRPVGVARRLAVGERAPVTPLAVTNLLISISVVYDSGAPRYRWNISGFFDWTGKPPNNGSGKDQVATAWANGLALHSDTAYGYYTNGAAISTNRNDMTPNVGTSWEFSECNISYCLSYANWGYLKATIKQSTFKGRDTNVGFKYFHTHESLSYGISFSGGGPSISISPNQSVTSTAVYTDFID